MTIEDLLLKLESDKNPPSEGMTKDAMEFLKLVTLIESIPAIECEISYAGGSIGILRDEYIYFRWETESKNVTVQIHRESTKYAPESLRVQMWRGIPFKKHRGFTIKSGRTVADIEAPNQFDFLSANLWLNEVQK